MAKTRRITFRNLALVCIIATSAVIAVQTWRSGSAGEQQSNPAAGHFEPGRRWALHAEVLAGEQSQQPVTVQQTLSYQETKERISRQSPLAGYHNKTGILKPEKWLASFGDRLTQKFAKWEEDVLAQRIDVQTDRPESFPLCWVHVNHHYRFVWIKIPKTAGSAMKRELAWACPDPGHPVVHEKAPYCSQRSWYAFNVTLDDARNWWRDYFVFTVVRNPYSRFASGFNFLNKSMKDCDKQEFQKICRDPFLQAKTCITDKCCFMQRSHVHHIAEQSTCIVSESGGIAVDFVGQTETIDEDLKTIVKEVNKRRKQGVPALKLSDSLAQHNQNPNVTSSDGYTSTYEGNPGCLDSVQFFYQNDLRNWGYET